MAFGVLNLEEHYENLSTSEHDEFSVQEEIAAGRAVARLDVPVVARWTRIMRSHLATSARGAACVTSEQAAGKVVM